MLGLLIGLVDKSLVTADEQPDGTARYRLLETLRQYARERLAAGGEDEAVRRRHAAYFLGLAEAAGPDLLGGRQSAWLDRLEREHDNLRAALEWLTERGAAEAGLRLADAVGPFWMTRGYLQEPRARLERLLALPGAEGTSLRARVARRYGGAGVGAGGLRRRAAPGRGGAGRLPRRRGRRRRGEGPGLPRAGGARPGRLRRGARPRGAGARAAAGPALAGAVPAAGDPGARRPRPRRVRHGPPPLRGEPGPRPRGRRPAADGAPPGELRVAGRLRGRPPRRPGALRGEPGAAAGTRPAPRRRGRAHGAGVGRRGPGRPAARAFLAESLPVHREVGNRFGIARALEGYAALAARAQPARALRLAGAAAALRAALGRPMAPAERPIYEGRLEPARRALGPRAADAARAAGAALPLEEAIAFASDGGAAGPPAAPRARRAGAGPSGRHLPGGLTAREAEVLGLLAARLSNREIAEALGLSVRTVERHLSNVYAKIGAHDRRGARAYAARHGLAAPPARLPRVSA